MDPLVENLAIHIVLGALVRSSVLAFSLRYLTGCWAPWQEILAASLSPVLLRALLGEAISLVWGDWPIIAQLFSGSAVVLLQVVTIRLATDHQRETITLPKVILIALIAQLCAHLISGPLARQLLGPY